MKPPPSGQGPNVMIVFNDGNDFFNDKIFSFNFGLVKTMLQLSCLRPDKIPSSPRLANRVPRTKDDLKQARATRSHSGQVSAKRFRCDLASFQKGRRKKAAKKAAGQKGRCSKKAASSNCTVTYSCLLNKRQTYGYVRLFFWGNFSTPYAFIRDPNVY